MNVCRFGLIFLLFLIVAVGGGSGGNNYITWDDLFVSAGRSFLTGVGTGRIIVVDQHGGGDFTTVQAAVNSVPENNMSRYKIHIKPGVYSEKVYIPASKPFISLIGDPSNSWSTVIRWHDKAGDVGTQRSATVAVESDYFCASGITFENTVWIPNPGADGYQAVALRIAGDKSVFYRANFLGYQDTLLDEVGTHYFYQCTIQGTTDFIFGNGRSLYKGCKISLVGYSYSIAAQKRSSPIENTGFSFVDCDIYGNGEIYLARAWGEYSRVVFSRCNLNINVFPVGWTDWGLPSRRRTVEFGEYQCRGKGSNRRGRAPWSKALSYQEATFYIDKGFISGETWLKL